MAKRYTIYDSNTQTVIATGRPWPTKDGISEPPGLEAGVKILEEIREDRPSYDEWTQKVERAAIVYTDTTATQGWNVVQLTAEEIADRTPAHYETEGGIKMGVEDKDQNAFSNLLTLLNESGAAEDSMIVIKDIYRNSHGMTVAQYRSAAVAYGLYCFTLFNS